MSSTETLDRELPGCLPAAQFVARTTELLAPYGFDAENAIACAGVCRDELARPLIRQLMDAWGEAFNFSSLAGLPTLGRTGFAAARGHAPRSGGRERFVFVTLPHIGIDSGGVLGQVERPGQEQPTPACGALMALLEERHRGELRPDLDPDDIEQSLLRRRLRPLLADGHIDIVALTRLARRAILEDLERLIAGSDMEAVDYAVFSGIQVHAPDAELVWPAESYVVLRGDKRELRVGEGS